MSDTIYQFVVKDHMGQDVCLDTLKGKALLIVNTASQCGFTSQYKGLQDLYEKYHEHLEILAFPCNQFGKQEPGNEQEILSFCQTNYGVTFPIFSKIDVNGSNASPLFVYLKKALPGLLGTKDIKWNFTKFLLSSEGIPLKRFGSKDSPAKIDEALKKLLF